MLNQEKTLSSFVSHQITS